MNKIKMREIYPYFLSAVLLFATAACTKTIGLDPVAQNKITQYKVINLPDTVIYGAIDNIENTVTVYVPYYYGMDVIQPKITLEGSATLSENPLPVSITDTTKTYTVKGPDGTTRTYKLLIIQQNTPDLSLSWSVENPISYPNELLSPIKGNFLSKSVATLKVELLSRTTNKTTLPGLTTASMQTIANTYGDTYALDGVTLPDNLDSGLYDVKINYLGHKVTMAKPIHITYRIPQIAPTWDTKTVVQGGTITFIPNASLFISLNTVKVTVLGKTYDLTIQSTTRQEAVLKIPDDFPIGNIGTVPFVFQFGNWETTTSQVPLSVTAK